MDALGSAAIVAVLVSGDAGAGKSRLVAEMAAGATATGARVLTGGCVALGAEALPYAPFCQAVGAVTSELGIDGVEDLIGATARADLARLLPELRRPTDDTRPPGASDRAVLFQAVLRTLEGVAAHDPLVLVIEDLHWADASSRELLAFLVGRLSGAVLIVATYRGDEVHRHHPLRPLLAEATRDRRVVRLDIAPLAAGDVAEQLEAIAGRPVPAEIVDAIVARAEGNPFFAEELLAAGGGPDLPPSLGEILAAHLASLQEDAYELVRIAAVAGRRVSHELLAAVSGGDPADLTVAVREATFHNVLVADPNGTYAFRHALLQQAAYDELLPGERQALHAAYAAALSDHPAWAATAAAAAGELAHHYAAAKDSARALPASMTAAAAAAGTQALDEAHGLYEQALALWDAVPDPAGLAGCDRAELLQRCSDAALLAGASARAIELVQSALEELEGSPDGTRAALLHWRRARLLWAENDSDGWLAAHRQAIALMPDTPSAERARILAGEGQVLMLTGRYQQSRARCEEAIEVARAAHARQEEAYALITLGAALSRLGEPDDAIACLELSISIAEDSGSVEDVWRAYANLSSALNHAAKLDRGIAVGRAGIARADALGYADGADMLRCVTSAALRDAGEWADADLLAAEALRPPVSDFVASEVGRLQATVALRRGDLEAARALLAGTQEMWSSADAESRVDLSAVEAELALVQGLADAARTFVARGLETVADSDGQDHLQRLLALGLRAEADDAGRSSGRDAAERCDLARAAAQPMIERSRGLSDPSPGEVAITPFGEAHRLLCEAEFSRVHGGGAAEPWDRAARAWAELSQPYEVGYARFREAEAHLDGGDKRAAAASLREAFAIATRLGAGPLQADVEALARRARVRVTSAAEPSADADDAAGLSPRELEVLELVAAGLTNREIAGRLFISTKTASVHVSHILTKLGVANRGQATAMAHRLALVGERPPAS